tara:strand:- start:7884 stop:8156 length:273 start_codon:yes stop_codon:yes gene_type:complete
MVTVISESKPTARKEHNCDACECLLAPGVNGMGYSFSELRAVVKAKRNNWKIVKGQKYVKQTNTFDGRVFTFKAIPEIHEICVKHNLYEM